MASGKVHLVYTGIEVAGLGLLITRIAPFGYWKTRANDKRNEAQKP